MSPDRALESVEALTEARHDVDHVAEQHRLTVAAALALPALCGPREMQRLLGIGSARFYRLLNAGALDFLKLRPAVGPKCFSGVLIGRWLSGEPVFVPSFGRKTLA